jgi:hypothetical protein
MNKEAIGYSNQQGFNPAPQQGQQGGPSQGKGYTIPYQCPDNMCGQGVHPLKIVGISGDNVNAICEKSGHQVQLKTKINQGQPEKNDKGQVVVETAPQGNQAQLQLTAGGDAPNPIPARRPRLRKMDDPTGLSSQVRRNDSVMNKTPNNMTSGDYEKVAELSSSAQKRNVDGKPSKDSFKGPRVFRMHEDVCPQGTNSICPFTEEREEYKDEHKVMQATSQARKSLMDRGRNVSPGVFQDFMNTTDNYSGHVECEECGAPMKPNAETDKCELCFYHSKMNTHAGLGKKRKDGTYAPITPYENSWAHDMEKRREKQKEKERDPNYVPEYRKTAAPIYDANNLPPPPPLPDDGYADGGEPYTQEELDDKMDFYCQAIGGEGIESPKIVKGRNHAEVYDFLGKRFPNVKSWDISVDPDTAFRYDDDVEHLDTDADQAEDSMPQTMPLDAIQQTMAGANTMMRTAKSAFDLTQEEEAILASPHNKIMSGNVKLQTLKTAAMYDQVSLLPGSGPGLCQWCPKLRASVQMTTCATKCIDARRIPQTDGFETYTDFVMHGGDPNGKIVCGYKEWMAREMDRFYPGWVEDHIRKAGGEVVGSETEYGNRRMNLDEGERRHLPRYPEEKLIEKQMEVEKRHHYNHSTKMATKTANCHNCSRCDNPLPPADNRMEETYPGRKDDKAICWTCGKGPFCDGCKYEHECHAKTRTHASISQEAYSGPSSNPAADYCTDCNGQGGYKKRNGNQVVRHKCPSCNGSGTYGDQVLNRQRTKTFATKSANQKKK